MDVPTLPNIVRNHDETLAFFKNITNMTLVVATANLAGTDNSREMLVLFRERMI